MRLFIATPLYPPQSGGPATYVKLLEERLPAFGYTLTILPFSTVAHLPKGIAHAAYAWRCFVRALSADAVLALDTVSVGLPAAAASFFAGKPLLVRVPGDHAWEQARQRYGVADSLDEFQTKRYAWRVELLRGIARFVVRRAARVIVPSAYMRRIVSGWTQMPEKIAVIYSGVELPVPVEAPAERSHGFLLVTSARLVPWKGIDALIRTVARNKAWHLVVVGDGPMRQELEDLAKEAAHGQVHFTGELPRAQGLGWAKSADGFVLNSTYEGLAHVLVEVMSLGTPVVVSDAGGNPEVVRDGIDGSVVPAGNNEALYAALSKVEQEPYRAKEMAASAVLRAKEFSIDRSVVALDALLKEI